MKKILFCILAVLAMTFTSAFAAEVNDNSPVISTVSQGTVIWDTQQYEGDGTLASEDWKAAFEQMVVEAWKNKETAINIYDTLKIERDEAVDYYIQLCYKYRSIPEYYYVLTSHSHRYVEDYDSKIYIYDIMPLYYETDQAVIDETVAAIKEEGENVLFLINDEMTEFDKVVAVHDYMVLNYHYDTASQNENHSISIMATKTGVCESYAFAFNYVMGLLGIDSLYVSSEAANHAWNLVKVDGQWYHIDLTQDDVLMTGSDSVNHDRPAMVNHTYLLCSSSKINDSNHGGFVMPDGITADCTKYDSADWHSDKGGMAHNGGLNYYVSGRNLVTDEGEVIYENLNRIDGYWIVTGGGEALSSSTPYSGVAEYNGKIYFNTESEILCYNPKNKETTVVAQEKYVCGLYIKKNTLVYNKFDLTLNCFVEAGSIKLGDKRYSKPYRNKEGKIVAKVYNDSDEDLSIIAFGNGKCSVKTAGKNKLTTVNLDVQDSASVFYLNEKLQPVREPLAVSKKD